MKSVTLRYAWAKSKGDEVYLFQTLIDRLNTITTNTFQTLIDRLNTQEKQEVEKMNIEQNFKPL